MRTSCVTEPTNGQREPSEATHTAWVGDCSMVDQHTSNMVPWIACSPKLRGSWYTLPSWLNFPLRTRPAYGTIGYAPHAVGRASLVNVTNRSRAWMRSDDSRAPRNTSMEQPKSGPPRWSSLLTCRPMFDAARATTRQPASAAGPRR